MLLTSVQIECVVLSSVCRRRCRRWIFSSYSYGRGTTLLPQGGNYAAFVESSQLTQCPCWFVVQPSSHWGHSRHHSCQQFGGCGHRRPHVPRVHAIWQGGGFVCLVKLWLDVLTGRLIVKSAFLRLCLIAWSHSAEERGSSPLFRSTDWRYNKRPVTDFKNTYLCNKSLSSCRDWV